MRNIISLIYLSGIFCISVFSGICQEKLTAKEIIIKADENMRGKSSRGQMTMTIVRPKWSRTVTMKSWSLGTDYAMVYITAPVKDKGQVFLKRGTEMWNWQPVIRRTIKLPASMMMQSWMGSDFTNDDLVKQSSIVKDYTHKLLGSGTIQDKECYKLELIPKPDAPVVWGKIIVWITKKGYHILKGEYYDEDEFLVHTENGYNIKHMGNRDIVTKMEIIPEDKKGQKTILEFDNMEFDIDISEDFFTQQNMKRIK